MGKEYVCICCFDSLDDVVDPYYVNFRFQIPGQKTPEQILIANVCDKCAKASDDPARFPVVEALILARVIRTEHPDMLFTPEDRKDG